MNVGKNLQIIREIHNYTQSYVADFLGISQKSYSNLEKANNNITVETIMKICELYKINVSKVLDFTTESILNINNQSGGSNFYNNHHANFYNDEKESYIQLINQQAKLIDAQLELIKEFTSNTNHPPKQLDS